MAISPNEILILRGQIGTHKEGDKDFLGYYNAGIPISMSDVHSLNTDNDILTREKHYNSGYTCYTN